MNNIDFRNDLFIKDMILVNNWFTLAKPGKLSMNAIGFGRRQKTHHKKRRIYLNVVLLLNIGLTDSCVDSVESDVLPRVSATSLQ